MPGHTVFIQKFSTIKIIINVITVKIKKKKKHKYVVF